MAKKVYRFLSVSIIRILLLKLKKALDEAGKIRELLPVLI